MTFFLKKKKIISEVDFFLISINLGSESSFFRVPEAEKGVLFFGRGAKFAPPKAPSKCHTVSVHSAYLEVGVGSELSTKWLCVAFHGQLGTALTNSVRNDLPRFLIEGRCAIPPSCS